MSIETFFILLKLLKNSFADEIFFPDFAIDLVVGSLYSIVAFSIASHFLLRNLDAKHEREMTTRGVDRLFCRTMRSTSQNINSYERLPSSARVAAQLEVEQNEFANRASFSRGTSMESDLPIKIVGIAVSTGDSAPSPVEMEEGRKGRFPVTANFQAHQASPTATTRAAAATPMTAAA